MIPVKTLWKGDFISVVSPNDYPYEAIHEGDGVLILPYLLKEDRFLIRKEFCPPYFIKNEKAIRYYTLISGNIEDNEQEVDAVFRELEEEAGVYDPNIVWFENNIPIPVFKVSDYLSSFYVLGIDEYDYSFPTGDGSKCEEKSETIKVTFEDIETIIETKSNYDMLLYMAYYKIKDLISEGRI